MPMNSHEWTAPSAMAIPAEGYSEHEYPYVAADEMQ